MNENEKIIDVTPNESKLHAAVKKGKEWIKNHKALTIIASTIVGSMIFNRCKSNKSKDSFSEGFTSLCVYRDCNGRIYHLNRPLTEKEYDTFCYRTELLGEHPLVVFINLGDCNRKFYRFNRSINSYGCYWFLKTGD